LEYLKPVVYYCDETAVPVWLACRMFSTECSKSGDPMDSDWNVHAVSWMGAQGIAQLMPYNLVWFSEHYNDGNPIDPFDPETAIRVGIRYLADLYRFTGSWKGAVEAYNCGPIRWARGDLPPETKAYGRDIMEI
jgi:soluble lytic murein transglycosylase-like protein